MTDTKSDIERIKELKASVAVELLEQIRAQIKLVDGTYGSDAMLALAQAYQIVAEHAPKPAGRPYVG